MKIRIHGNSIRLRLNRPEVSSFASAGCVESVIHFPGSSLSFALESDGTATSVAARYSAGRIRICIPAREAADWARGDEVSVRGVCNLPDAGHLEILVEKDFQCLHKGQQAKDPDAYPNPDAMLTGE